MKTVTTTSGAIYEFDKLGQVRRVNDSHVKRGDAEWQKLTNKPTIEVGRPMILVMESLARYGGDDYGTKLEDVSPYTTRRTTAVTMIETDD